MLWTVRRTVICMEPYMTSMMSQLRLLVQRSTPNFHCYIIFLENMCTSRELLCSPHNSQTHVSRLLQCMQPRKPKRRRGSHFHFVCIICDQIQKYTLLNKCKTYTFLFFRTGHSVSTGKYKVAIFHTLCARLVT